MEDGRLQHRPDRSPPRLCGPHRRAQTAHDSEPLGQGDQAVSETPLTGSESLPPESAQHVDKICDRVEAAWKEGLRPESEDYLKETAGPLRAVLLHELVALELAYRRSRDEQPTEEEYR